MRKELPADEVNKIGNESANWLTLYHQVEIPGCSHRIHIPVFSPCDLWEIIGGIPFTFAGFMYLFRLHNEEVGVVMIVYNDVITEKYLEECDLLGDQVSL